MHALSAALKAVKIPTQQRMLSVLVQNTYMQEHIRKEIVRCHIYMQCSLV